MPRADLGASLSHRNDGADDARALGRCTQGMQNWPVSSAAASARDLRAVIIHDTERAAILMWWLVVVMLQKVKPIVGNVDGCFRR